ncbi:MAG TPA: hypothetical protein VH912_28815 [Streptosporangiaceae bacterium]|jgi:hypothetical protein
MNPHDAQASLDGIHRLQDRTRAEYVRHGFARPYLVISALAMFIVLASFDLPSPWNTAAIGLGGGLAVGSLLVQQRRAPVSRRPTGLELLVCAAMSVGLLLLYVAFSIVAAIAHQKLGLPAHHTVAAAAITLTTVAAWGRVSRVFEATLRRESRHG